VDTEEEANRLITVACPLGWDNKRHGLPGVLRADEYEDAVGAPRMRAMEESFRRVTDHLAEWNARLKPKERTA
jgi:hypothetical protein